jgi:hypothetical protein
LPISFAFGTIAFPAHAQGIALVDVRVSR